MAAIFTKDSGIERSISLYTFLPEDITIKAGMTGRKEADKDIMALAADILANGQNTPVLFRKDETDKPVLVYGHRRVAAIDYLNKHLLKSGEEKVRVQGKYERMSDIEAFIAAVSENRFRKDASPVDDAYNIEQFVTRHKLSFERIAGIYFPEAKSAEAKADAVRWVKVRSGLTELAEEAKDAVKDGRLTVTAAAEMAKLPKEKQREVIVEAKASGSKLKGKERIKVSAVKAKSGKAKKPVAPAPAHKAPTPTVKPTTDIYGAAEMMARALDDWKTDATSGAEKAVWEAHDMYRALVPAPRKKSAA